MYLCLLFPVYKYMKYNPTVSFYAINVISGTLLIFVVFFVLTYTIAYAPNSILFSPIYILPFTFTINYGLVVSENISFYGK